MACTTWRGDGTDSDIMASSSVAGRPVARRGDRPRRSLLTGQWNRSDSMTHLLEKSLLADRRRRQAGLDAVMREDQHLGGGLDDVAEVGRRQDHRTTVLGELADHPVDLGAGL